MKRKISMGVLLVGCLAVAPAGADDEKTEKIEKKKHVKVMVVGDQDCGEGGGLVEVVEDDGTGKIIRKRFGFGPRGFLGVHLVSLTPQLRKHYSGDEDAGVLIGKVEPDSPASRAGIKVGDVLVTVDGEKVRSAMKIGRLIGAKKKGDEVKLRVVRSGARKDLKAFLDKRKRPFVNVGKFLHRVGEEGDFDFDFDFQFDPGDFGEMIDAEVFEKLSDPILKKKIKILKRHENMEKRLEEKLKKVEKRLKKLEKKLQGKVHKAEKHAPPASLT